MGRNLHLQEYLQNLQRFGEAFTLTERNHVPIARDGWRAKQLVGQKVGLLRVD